MILQLVLTVISSPDLEADKPVPQPTPPQWQQQQTASQLPGVGSWFCHWGSRWSQVITSPFLCLRFFRETMGTVIAPTSELMRSWDDSVYIKYLENALQWQVLASVSHSYQSIRSLYTQMLNSMYFTLGQHSILSLPKIKKKKIFWLLIERAENHIRAWNGFQNSRKDITYSSQERRLQVSNQDRVWVWGSSSYRTPRCCQYLLKMCPHYHHSTNIKVLSALQQGFQRGGCCAMHRFPASLWLLCLGYLFPACWVLVA